MYRKIGLLGVAILLVVTLGLSHAAQNEIQVSSEEANKASVRTNTAPVFDPLSTYQLLPGSEKSVVLGASDLEWEHIDLSVTGENVKSVTITKDEPGRVEAIVVLVGSQNWGTQQDVLYSARDDRGAITTVTVPVTTVEMVANQPILFSSLSHQSIEVGKLLEINFFIRSNDGDILDLLSVLPEGAELTILENLSGFLSARIVWVPNPYQVGVHDLQLFAQEPENSALATVRIKVLRAKE